MNNPKQFISQTIAAYIPTYNQITNISSQIKFHKLPYTTSAAD